MQIALANALINSASPAYCAASADIVLDFGLGTAFWQGAIGPLAERITCIRDTSGMAMDMAGALHDFAPNVLRRTARGLLIEEARTNFVPHSFAPAPADTTLAAGNYTLSLLGPGTVTATGAYTGVATHAEPLTFTLDAQGTLTLTPSSGVLFMQLENGSFVTSPIATGAAPVTRDFDRITFADTAWFNPQNCTMLVEWEQVAPPSGVQTLLRWQNATYSRLRSGSGAFAQVNDATGTLILNIGAPGGPPAPGIHRLAAALAPNDMEVAWSASLGNGAPGSASDTNGIPAAAPTAVILGSTLSGEFLNGWIRKLAFWQTHVDTARLLSVVG